MFSLENNPNPLFYPPTPSFTDMIPETDTPFFQHHHPSTQEAPMAILSSEPLTYHQNYMLCPSNNIINHTSSSNSKRTQGKKDRHTKISTAQGVRDRRVRLSMSIAKDFFNLQDMLGFDKASKTLGWLMAKSKAAIDELRNSSSSKNKGKPNNENTNVSNNNDKKCEDLGAKSSSYKKKNKRENNLNGRNVSMEMKRREEARNRARERTRNKKLNCDNSLNQLQIVHHQQDLMNFQSSNNNDGAISNGVSSMNDQESCNYNNNYFNKFTSEMCNYGELFQAPNIINMSTEIHINARPWDT